MRYYSEITKKLYDSTEELESAERAEKEKLDKEAAKKAERAEDAKIVEELYKKANEAYKEANGALREFIEKHGNYHTTISNVSAHDLFDTFFDKFFL